MQVVAKGKFSSAFNSSCTVNPVTLHNSKITLESSFGCECKRTTMVTVNTNALGLVLNPNETYSFVLSAGFVTDAAGEDSPQQTISYTSNPPPVTVSTFPVDGSTGITNNRTLALTFDRRPGLGTGNISLYKTTGNILVNSFNVEDNPLVYKSGATIWVKYLGYLAANTDYYILADQGSVIDGDGIGWAGISSPTTLNFKTATSATFPDLASSVSSTFNSTCLGRKLLTGDLILGSPDYDFNYIEDSSNFIKGNPRVNDVGQSGSGNYTVTITPSTTSAVLSLTPGTVSGGGWTFNNSTKVLTITGNRDQVNARLESLTFVPGTDFASDFTMTYRVTTPSGSIVSQIQNMILKAPYDIEVTNLIGIDRNYLANVGQSIWGTTVPYISDFDTSSSTYQITLSSALGGFASASDGSDFGSPFVYSGTKEQVNQKIASLKFYPNKGTYSNGTFLYVQKKNNITQVSVNINLFGTNQSFSPVTYEFNATGTTSSSGSWTPTFEEIRYGGFVDFLLVGGGGGGAAGFGYGPGGGGGGFYEKLNSAITQQAYGYTVGGGGLGNSLKFTNNSQYFISQGETGKSTIMFGITVTGGGGGSWEYDSNFTQISKSGSSGYAPGYTTYAGVSGYLQGATLIGAGGSGPGGLGFSRTIITGDPTYYGGNGGVGQYSQITNYRYAGGGGGAKGHITNIPGVGNVADGGLGVDGGGNAGRFSSVSSSIASGINGTDGKGGGGGGCAGEHQYTTTATAGNGGSGIIIIKVHA